MAAITYIATGTEVHVIHRNRIHKAKVAGVKAGVTNNIWYSSETVILEYILDIDGDKIAVAPSELAVSREDLIEKL